ncbi:MAG TPA: hypothetical protein VMA31_00180 [Bryobacteraceae bacterium]|nr:hypothetical protein [Bryobacteraceae bacterium]
MQNTTVAQTSPKPPQPPASEAQELQPIIRTGVESELSKYPVHNLSQRDSINIEIHETNERGQTTVKWEVSYNNRFGRPGPLAYKADTMIVNRRIDEARGVDAYGIRTPIPEVLWLGTLHEIAEMLKLGRNTNHVKRALRQNVGIIISAKIKQKRADGTERFLEADFSRYGIVFTGEKLPDGSKANGVYLVISRLFLEILNCAPIQPQNWAHTEMPAASHRFYVLLSSRMYATLESGGREARMLYSYFCERAPLTRHENYRKFKSQMYKIQKPLKEAGYIDEVRWEERTDAGGKRDWMMCYTPGPLAKAEYNAFNPNKKQIPIAPGELTPLRKGRRKLFLDRPAQVAEQQAAVLNELAKRGVGEADAALLLNDLAPGQSLVDVLDLLEYGDYLISRRQGKIENPPGFYISLLRRRVPLPPGFISSRKAREIQAANRARQQALREEQEAAERAEQEVRSQLDAQIDALPAKQLLTLFEQAKARLLASHPGMAMFFRNNPDAIHDGAVRARMRQIFAQTSQ